MYSVPETDELLTTETYTQANIDMIICVQSLAMSSGDNYNYNENNHHYSLARI